MRKRPQWFQTLLSSVISRTIAALLVGAIVPLLFALFSLDLSEFLLQRIRVPVSLLSILSLFALLGILASAVPIWNLISASRQRKDQPPPRDEVLESAFASLLARLNEVETSKQIHVQYEIRQFHSSTLTLFDGWESAISPYMDADGLRTIEDLRTEISGRSLQHSKDEAVEWVRLVKGFTNQARERIT